MQCVSSVKIPRCWKRLIDVAFCYADENLSTYAIEGHPHMLVKKATQRTSLDDPEVYYDDARDIGGSFDDGAVFRLSLVSGQGNYYGDLCIEKDGETVGEYDPLEVLDDEIEVIADDGTEYILKIEWEGEDPYENGYPEER